MEHMIDEGGVALREKKMRLREARLTLINGLCLYIYMEKHTKNVEGCLSELAFFFPAYCDRCWGSAQLTCIISGQQIVFP